MAFRAELDGIAVETDTIDEMVQLLRPLRVSVAAERVAQPELDLPAPLHHKRRGRRCRYCRATDHMGDRCPKNPFIAAVTSVARGDAPPSPAPTEDRVCAVHERPVEPAGDPKPNGRQAYTCDLGCLTENTIVRRRTSG